MTLEDIK
jgi:hypothetical protein